MLRFLLSNIFDLYHKENHYRIFTQSNFYLFSYLIRSKTLTNSAITPFVAETICPLTRTLEIYDTSKLVWTQYLASLSSTYPWITSWTDPVGSAPAYTTTTNGFVVTTADYATYDNEFNSPSVF